MVMRIATAVFVLTALVVPAAADDERPPDADNRYSYHRVEDGFVRLDMRTGQVSLCARRAGGWSCQTVPDDRSAFEGEIARLSAENAALKKELIDRGLTLPPIAKSESRNEPPAAKSSEPTIRLPTQADVDRAMALIEKIWRRFIEMIVSVQQDLQKKT